MLGQPALCREVMIGLLGGGNVLIEGQPGLGKTLLVRTLADALAIEASRIQFTPDLMPADITGTQVLMRDDTGKSTLEFRKGPLFANLVLADEINRATPKTQSALLEAMQEHAITVAGVRYQLTEPFCVIATQNPIETEGTYPLPEAQLDRFLVKVVVGFPTIDVLRSIGIATTGTATQAARRVMTREQLIAIQRLVRQIVVAPHVAEVAAKITMATHPEAVESPARVKKLVRFGASPRAMQALLLAGRANALLAGRAWVGAEDLIAVAPPVLRHRMILGFDATLDGVTTDALVGDVLGTIQ
ncbi:MAG TPA: MoxR family ATPase [Kofleriaceae bacterium]|nr:MoxR family ATPase [Kofleriaceae bacterium]